MTSPLHSTGNPEIDRLRREVKAAPTTAETLHLRGYMLKQWVCILQQIGMNVEAYLPVDQRFQRQYVANGQTTGGRPQLFTPAELKAATETVDEGYRILEEVQTRLATRGVDGIELSPLAAASRPTIPTADDADAWPQYQANRHHTGSTSAPGPMTGKVTWRKPIGVNTYARPAVEGDHIYVSSPGMRTVMYCLNGDTGETLWESKQDYAMMIDQHYWSAANFSSPVILRDHVLLRQLGSRGNRGETKYVVFIDKETGRPVRKIEVGHIDYKAGWSPFQADESHLVCPYGEHNMEGNPSVFQPMNRMVCRDVCTGNVTWDLTVGHIGGEPLLDGNDVFVGTQHGVVYCVCVRPDRAAEQNVFNAIIDGEDRNATIRWQCKIDGGVNHSFAVDDRHVWFGANDGGIHCLDRATGAPVWKYVVEAPEPRAFKQFTTPLIHGDCVFVGGANRMVYCLDRLNGALRWTHRTKDWVRARPLVCRDRLFVMAMDGMLTILSLDGKVLGETRIATHPVYSDLVRFKDTILVNDTNLTLWCVDRDGAVRWHRPVIDSFTMDGRRILTDQLAGGTYFQGKCAAADGSVFFGTHSRFVHAVDPATGAEKWKFEMSAAVCTAPTFSAGRLFVGQQGGADDYFCLDARTGLPLWRQTVGWVWGSANVADGRIFVPCLDGFVNCLDAATGHLIWRYRTGRMVCTEPVSDGKFVYFGSWDNCFYAFEAATGRMAWQFQLGGISDSGAQIAVGGKVYLPMGGSTFRCLDGATGRILWEFKPDKTLFNASAAYADGRIFVSAWFSKGLGGIAVNTKIFCLDARDGQLLWTHVDGGGLNGPAVAGGRVYFGSTASPYFYGIDAKGNGDGTTACHFRTTMEGRLEEVCPCVYRGRAYVLSAGGYFYAFE